MSSSGTNSGQGMRPNLPSSTSLQKSFPLLAAATSVHMAVKDGKISSNEGRNLGQQILQAHKDTVNLQIINSNLRK